MFVSIVLMAVTYLLLAYSTVSGFNDNGKALAAAEIPFISVAHGAASWLAFFAYMAGMTSTLGVLIAAVNSQCRLIFNAGREGLLPRWIGRVTRSGGRRSTRSSRSSPWPASSSRSGPSAT